MDVVQLKIAHGDTLRKVPYPCTLPPSPYDSLLVLIKQRFNLANSAQIELLVKDEDGDCVTISTDLELQELFASLAPEQKSLRVQLHVKGQDNSLPAGYKGANFLPSRSVSAVELSKLVQPGSLDHTYADANLRATTLREADFPPLASPSGADNSFPDDLASPSPFSNTAPAPFIALSGSLPSLLAGLRTRANSLSSLLAPLLHPIDPSSSTARAPSLTSLANSFTTLFGPSFSASDLPNLTEEISSLTTRIASAAWDRVNPVHQAVYDFEKGMKEFRKEVEEVKTRWMEEVLAGARAQSGTTSQDGVAQFAASTSTNEQPALTVVPPTASGSAALTAAASPALSGASGSRSTLSAPPSSGPSVSAQQDKQSAKLVARAEKEERKRVKEQERREKEERREARAARRKEREERRAKREVREEEVRERKEKEEKVVEKTQVEEKKPVQGACQAKMGCAAVEEIAIGQPSTAAVPSASIADAAAALEPSSLATPSSTTTSPSVAADHAVTSTASDVLSTSSAPGPPTTDCSLDEYAVPFEDFLNEAKYNLGLNTDDELIQQGLRIIWGDNYGASLDELVEVVEEFW